MILSKREVISKFFVNLVILCFLLFWKCFLSFSTDRVIQSNVVSFICFFWNASHPVSTTQKIPTMYRPGDENLIIILEAPSAEENVSPPRSTAGS